MVKTFTAPFAQTPKRVTAAVTTAHTVLEGTTNTVLAYTAGADGAVITRLNFMPTATQSTAGVAYLYSSTDSGSTVQTIKAVPVAAVTPSTTVAGVPTDCGYTEDAPLRLAATERLYVAFSLTVNGRFTGDAMDY